MDYNSLITSPLKPQQFDYLDYAVDHHYCMVAARQGNGKTLVGIVLGLMEGGLTVVVAPAFLKINWMNEFKNFSKKELKIIVVTGARAKKINPSDWDVIILNYAILGKCEHLFNKARTIIFDEAHYLLNPKAQRTKAAVSYINKYEPSRMLMLTGTPNKGKGKQWFVPLFLCSINPRGTSGKDMRDHVFTYWDFQNRFCEKHILNIGGRTVTQFDGIKNIPTLKKLLKGKYIRGKKVDHGNIELIFQGVQCAFEPDTLLEQAWKEFESGSKITQHTMSAKSQSALVKVPFTIDYVKNLLDQNEGPVVVYTDHLASLEALVEGFKAKKLRVGKINGSTPMNKRQDIVDAFQRGDLDVFAATITSANTGLTLTTARHMVMNDENWDFTQNDQAWHRIFRIGQKFDCVIHGVYGSEIDKMISKNLKKRQAIIEKIVRD